MKKKTGGIRQASSSPLTDAIDQLEAKKADLQRQQVAIDVAIRALRDVDAAAVVPATKVERGGFPRAVDRRSASPKGDGPQEAKISDDAVRAALRKGPLKPKALGAALKLSSYLLRQVLKDLEARHVVVVTGVTNDRRVALPGSPAKEAP